MGRVIGRPLWAGGATPMDQGEPFGHWLVSQDAVRLRAYFISLETGGRNPDQDWKRAEQEFRAEASGPKEVSGSPFEWSYER